MFEAVGSSSSISNARRRASLSTGNGNVHLPSASPLHQVYDGSQAGINILMEAAVEQDNNTQTSDYDDSSDARMIESDHTPSPRNKSGNRRSSG